MKTVTFFAAAGLAATALTAAPAMAVTVDFEAQGAGAPSAFSNAGPSSVTSNGATFSGGQLLKNETFSVDKTAVYGTAYFDSGFADLLKIDFGTIVNAFSFDLVNESAGTYTVTTNNGVAQSFSVGDNQYFNISLGGSGVSSATIVYNTSSLFDFAIDNVNFAPAVAAVPEPGTWLMFVLGIGSLGFAMRRRKNAIVTVNFA